MALRPFVLHATREGLELLIGLGRQDFMAIFGSDGQVSLDLHALVALYHRDPPVLRARSLSAPEPRDLAAFVRSRPEDVKLLMRALEGDFGISFKGFADVVGFETALRLAKVFRDSGGGVEYLRRQTSLENVAEAMLHDFDAFSAQAAKIHAKIFRQANDGTFLMLGPEPRRPVPLPRGDLEAVVRSLGLDPGVLDAPRPEPRAVARLIARLRADLPSSGLERIDLEMDGRRFVDRAHFEEAYAAGVLNPHELYGREDFRAWKEGAAIIQQWANSGRALTSDGICRLHRVVARNLFMGPALGQLRATPGGPDDVRQAPQTVTPEVLESLRQNRDLGVIELGVGRENLPYVMVFYLSPAYVERRLDEMLARLESRLKSGEDPVAVAADAQREFVSIHPFRDGNGRLSRLVMDYALARGGLPPSVVRDPDLDTMLTEKAWRDEVAAGLRIPLDVTLQAWARARGSATSPPSASH